MRAWPRAGYAVAWVGNVADESVPHLDVEAPTEILFAPVLSEYALIDPASEPDEIEPVGRLPQRNPVSARNSLVFDPSAGFAEPSIGLFERILRGLDPNRAGNRWEQWRSSVRGEV